MGNSIEKVATPMTTCLSRSFPIICVEYHHLADGIRVFHSLRKFTAQPIQTINNCWH